MAKVPDRPDPAKRQEAALGQLRGSVLWGMGLFFAMAMAVVAMAVSFGPSDAPAASAPRPGGTDPPAGHGCGDPAHPRPGRGPPKALRPAAHPLLPGAPGCASRPDQRPRESPRVPGGASPTDRGCGPQRTSSGAGHRGPRRPQARERRARPRRWRSAPGIHGTTARRRQPRHGPGISDRWRRVRADPSSRRCRRRSRRDPARALIGALGGSHHRPLILLLGRGLRLSLAEPGWSTPSPQRRCGALLGEAARPHRRPGLRSRASRRVG